MATKKKRLQELRGSDFEIAKHQPDIRGWEVRNGTGHLIGKVQELIFDSVAHKVRYMVVSVTDSKELQLEKRTVLIPIGLAVLEPKDDDVILENVTPYQLRALPRYTKEDLGSRSERAISEVFGKMDKSNATANPDEDVDAEFYNHDYFNEENMYRKRPQATNTNTSSSAQQQIVNDKYRQNKEDDQTTIRQETEISKPAATTNSQETTSKDTVVVQRLEGETDEEYIRRIMNKVDNK